MLGWAELPKRVTVSGPADPPLARSYSWATDYHIEADGTLRWSITNHEDEPVPLEAVRLIVDLGPRPDPVRMFCHGFQSWSGTRMATLGVDADPASRLPVRGAWLVRQMHHADHGWIGEETLRSELVTVLSFPGRPLACFGFEGGSGHDGTFRLTRGQDGHVELVIEAFVGGAVLRPGERRELHPVLVSEGDDLSSLLEGWAARAGAANQARHDGPYQAGWCSWYHWFTSVREADVLDNLARAADWPFDVFQVDDGYQADIGDWLQTKETFPHGTAAVADRIRQRGMRAGIWLAPFLAMPGSRLAREHPDWLAEWSPGRPLIGNDNPAWGGHALALDVTRPEVLDHLAHVAATFVAEGYSYLKLDFLYAAHLPGRYADSTLTPAQRVRLGLDAIRRGAGDDTFLLGCGCPLGPAIGVVDGMRIGPDVAPRWWPEHGPDIEVALGYADVLPSTANAWQATLARSFQHRRLWQNDPDCVMLRAAHTALEPEAARAWADAVAISGGLAFVSDDLALLGSADRHWFAELLATGNRADAAAREGRPARAPDLLDHTPARSFEAGGWRVDLPDRLRR